MKQKKRIHLITGYLLETLSDEEYQEFHSGVENGLIDSDELESMKEIYCQLGHLPVSKSDSGLKERFHRMLESEKRQVSSGPESSKIKWWLQIAAVMLLTLSGFAAGWHTNSSEHSGDQVVAIQTDIERIKNALVFNPIIQTPASKRMQAVGWATQLNNIDDQVLLILIHTMNNDPNTNVRLASIDALRSFTGKREVRRIFIQALAVQDDPLVQISLIDALTELKEQEAINEMERLLTAESTHPEVKHRLIEGIAELQM